MYKISCLQFVRNNCVYLLFYLCIFNINVYANEIKAGISPPVNPDQELIRQQERQEQLRATQEPRIDVNSPNSSIPDLNDELPLNESPCFPIRRINLIGELSDYYQFKLALKEAKLPLQGYCLGEQGINVVMKRVQNAIVKRGFITTRVLAGSQDLNSGILTLTLVPGKVNEIRLIKSADPKATLVNALPIAPGDMLNLRDIEQGLENFKRVPTAQADIQIVPSTTNTDVGMSDIEVDWQQDRKFRWLISADDSGSDATGKYQGNLTTSIDNIFNINDLFYFSLNHDLHLKKGPEQGTLGYVVHYSLPMGYWQLALTSSQNEYDQSVAGAYETYVYSGESQNHEIALNRIIYRDDTVKTTLSVKGWAKRSFNEIDDTIVEVQRRRTAGWEFELANRVFISQATWDLSTNYRRGTGAWDALAAPEELFDEGTSRMKIISVQTQLSIPFNLGTQAVTYTNLVKSQWNKTLLVPQDYFSIGGRYSVRGFDGESSLSSERGWLTRNELVFGLENAQDHSIYLGVDYGHVSGPSAEYLLGTSLAGGVIGFRGAPAPFNYDVFFGGPIHMPHRFNTATAVLGFSVSAAF